MGREVEGEGTEYVEMLIVGHHYLSYLKAITLDNRKSFMDAENVYMIHGCCWYSEEVYSRWVHFEMQKYYRWTHYFLSLYENAKWVWTLLFDLYTFWIGFGTLPWDGLYINKPILCVTNILNGSLPVLLYNFMIRRSDNSNNLIL